MKSSAMRSSSSISMAVLLMAGILLFIATTSHAAPHIPGSPYYSSLAYEGQNPEYILQTLARLRQALIAEEDLENAPKLIDFGIGRGESGSIEAIQRMAINSGIAPDDLKNSKRGLDLGLGRGFSGSQAAKHLMGLAAANFAGSPGRRRRSDEEA